VGLRAWEGKYGALMVGYDTECDQGGSTKADNDIADDGDDIALNEPFDDTETRP
jgi:hypothetical protein